MRLRSPLLGGVNNVRAEAPFCSVNARSEINVGEHAIADCGFIADCGKSTNRSAIRNSFVEAV
jgi:hypothetical protein